MKYRRCGSSGLLLPVVSLGLWYNFGAEADPESKRAMCRRAFDLGITHFDLANNYGPPPGAAEESFRDILKDFDRDQLVIATKAGYRMWPGPYGDGGSRKYLLSSLDQSLKRMGLDYVDIFYHHRFDPETPLEETAMALDQAVRSGRALYAGISTYDANKTRAMSKLMRGLGTPILIHQPRYNMLQREPEHEGLFDAIQDEGMGSITFSSLAQGLLSDRYLKGIPEGSRATYGQYLDKSRIDEPLVARLKSLNAIASARGQSLAQLAITWNLSQPAVTTALIGASRVEQIEDCAKAAKAAPLTPDEIEKIERLI